MLMARFDGSEVSSIRVFTAMLTPLCGELLAVRVGTLETAEISTVHTNARHEESHGVSRWFGTRLLLCSQHRSGHDGCGGSKNKHTSLHLDLLVKSRRQERAWL